MKPLAHLLVELAAELLTGRVDDAAARERMRAILDGREQLALAPELAPNAKSDEERAAAHRLFDYWRERCGHLKAKPDPTRIAKAIARLRDGFSEEELRWAIDGMSGSIFHSGGNDDGKRYDDMELCFRNIRHVERFIERARGQGGGVAAPRQERDEQRAKLRGEAQKAARDGRTDDYNIAMRKLKTT